MTDSYKKVVHEFFDPQKVKWIPYETFGGKGQRICIFGFEIDGTEFIFKVTGDKAARQVKKIFDMTLTPKDAA